MVDFEKEVRLQATLDALNVMKTQTQQIIERLRTIPWHIWAQKIRAEVEEKKGAALYDLVEEVRSVRNEIFEATEPAAKVAEMLRYGHNFVGSDQYQETTNKTLTRLFEEKQSDSNDRDL